MIQSFRRSSIIQPPGGKFAARRFLDNQLRIKHLQSFLLPSDAVCEIACATGGDSFESSQALIDLRTVMSVTSGGQFQRTGSCTVPMPALVYSVRSRTLNKPQMYFFASAGR